MCQVCPHEISSSEPAWSGRESMGRGAAGLVIHSLHLCVHCLTALWPSVRAECGGRLNPKSAAPQVDKILGPGNQYVTAAKMLLQNSEAMIAMDMPAGPSEVLVIADSAARPAFIAADLLSQAEHGPDSQVRSARGTLRTRTG